MGYTERERTIMRDWPVVTHEDVVKLNDLFSHYIFFRKENLHKLETVKLWASCCGHKEIRTVLQRTETPEHRELLYHLIHKEGWTCPWCGRSVTMINLSKAGKRKSLTQTDEALLLHAKDGALYADALWLRKEYSSEEALTAPPKQWTCAGYRFTEGEVMELDYQVYGDDPWISYEAGILRKQKLVQEPFKTGCISFYGHEHYRIVNREEMNKAGIYQYTGYFTNWENRMGGGRGYKARFDDFVSYMTAYSIYPRQMEMLVKAGYLRPVCDLLDTRKRNVKAMDWSESDPCKAFGVTKKELSFLLKEQPPLEALEVRNYVQRHFGKRWTLPFCADFCRLMNDPMEVLKFLKEFKLDPERFIRYLGGRFDEEHIEHFTYSMFYQTYRDYLEAAYALGWSMDHSKVLWPKGLLTAHDTATRQLAERTYQDVDGRTAKGLRARMQKYEFELDGLKIVFPVTAGAIKREGNVLGHCVGGYAKRHMDGVLTILFLRKSAAPGAPYVTIEMHGNELRQIHGYLNDRNGPDPRKVHKRFIDTWLKWLKDGSKRNEDGTPKLPKKKKKEDAAA